MRLTFSWCAGATEAGLDVNELLDCNLNDDEFSHLLDLADVPSSPLVCCVLQCVDVRCAVLTAAVCWQGFAVEVGSPIQAASESFDDDDMLDFVWTEETAPACVLACACCAPHARL